MMITKEIRVGTFDQRIIIEQPNQAADSFGQASYGVNAPQGTWSQVIECWSRISPVNGKELRESGKDISELFVTIEVRYRAGLNVTPKMRARHKQTGVIYDIRAVSHIEYARRVIELTCTVVK
jgi:SPP1 family predicted phage head-tail adaptor